MADRPQQQQQQFTASRVLAVVALFLFSSTFLFVSGITLTGTIIVLAVTTPLFVIFSPVIVPAAFGIGLAMLGFLTSGALGITALSSVYWLLNYFRRMRGSLPRQMKHATRRAQKTTA